MTDTSLRFVFDPAISMTEAVGTLMLARMSAASLVGDERVRLEAPFNVNRKAREIVVGTSGKVGRITALIFSGLARREFGWQAFAVEHLCSKVDAAQEISV